MRKRILVAVTALMLATRLSSTFTSAQTAEELGTIEDYLNANDVQGLRDYLREHAELTRGSSSLATLLRRFMVESAAPNNFFRFDPNLSDSLGDAQQPSTSGPSALGPAY